MIQILSLSVRLMPVDLCLCSSHSSQFLEYLNEICGVLTCFNLRTNDIENGSARMIFSTASQITAYVEDSITEGCRVLNGGRCSTILLLLLLLFTLFYKLISLAIFIVSLSLAFRQNF